ncbi:conserved hypothetical protein [Desulforamulus reducens MI-1]|uniref:Uncharacterized protein n=1 Tax=Desulforamulus reducens (strain ATCC BAA-1160 / DSM 100696 / MI-1) TaxID=349161 RepID=A4J473_DESRM|nr:CBO0543 family protein [Desulforamulus reducens]ABO49876.1 conserved hypothetical protein [Desulforamulus reducens MI-1]
MPWFITAIVSWTIFYFLVDVRYLRKTIFGGIFTLILGSMVDWGGQQLGLYKFYDVIIPWAGCSIFYKFGPIFTMGVLFTQYLPRKRALLVLNILVVSLLYLGLEMVILQTNAAEYKQWHFLASFIVDLGAFTTLTWVAQTFHLAPAYQGWRV